jgi:hypothetical protein
MVSLSLLAVACVPTALTAESEVTPSETATWTAIPPKDPGATPTSFDYAACEDSLSWMLSEVESDFYVRDDLRDIYRLVTYQVGDNGLSDPEYGFAPESLIGYQGDMTRHEHIWSFTSGLVPPELRGQVKYFLVYTDGVGDSLGAVQVADTPYSWVLAIDIQDADDFAALSITLVHEMAHLLTLNSTQITTDLTLFYNPEDENVYRQAEEECDTFFVSEGCAKVDSYINVFFQQFWPGIYGEWQEVDAATSLNSYLNGLENLYEQYPDWFVSEYAVSHPVEDIAESFLHFIFTPRPVGATIAEQKVIFFYNYSELSYLRPQIIQTLCTQMP